MEFAILLASLLRRNWMTAAIQCLTKSFRFYSTELQWLWFNSSCMGLHIRLHQSDSSESWCGWRCIELAWKEIEVNAAGELLRCACVRPCTYCLPADVFRLMRNQVQESNGGYVDARRITERYSFNFVMSAHLTHIEGFVYQLMELSACQDFASALDVSDFVEKRDCEKNSTLIFCCWCRCLVSCCLVTPFLQQESNRKKVVVRDKYNITSRST